LANIYEFHEETDFPSSPDDAAHVFLADLCRRIRAPLYAYDEILKWAQESYLSGYRFPTNAPTYRHLISSLRNRLHLNHLSHDTATIQKCGGGTLEFPMFDFKHMFHDLIDDYRISPHLLINFEDPNKPPSFNAQHLDEVHTGKWHRLTSHQLIRQSKDILCGIIFFFDRTHVANKDKLSLCPLMFTLSIIPRWIRNQPYAWRPLGYFPKLPHAKKFGQNIDTLHRCLDVLLSGLVMAQRSGGLTTPVLRADGSSIELCFKVPLCFIIGDVEGHDELCARYGSHQSHRLCRECDCLTASSDNPDINCRYIKSSFLSELRRVNDIETLKSFSFHNVNNAFDNVCFGANEFGIHRATPTEVLHSIQKGWYLYALEGFYQGMGGQSIRNFLERLVTRVSADCAHQSDRNMPRLKFSNGIQSYANLQAHETTGVLLLIIIALHCKIGWDNTRTDPTTSNSFARSHHCNVRVIKDYRNLFELLLCMEQWLKLPTVSKDIVTPIGGHFSDSPAKSAIRIAVKKFIDTVNRKEGMGMKLTKTHSLLHVPDDVLMFGSGKNWDSGPSESNHKENVKSKAKLTSLCKDSLEDQVATRFEESLIIEHAKGILFSSNDKEGINVPSPVPLDHSSGTRIKVTISWSGRGIPRYDSVIAAWDGRKGTKFGSDSTIHFPQHPALSHLLEIVHQAHESIVTTDDAQAVAPCALVIPCFTDHKVYENIPDCGTCQIFRAHPAYRGLLPWNDWVYVQYCISTRRGRHVTNNFERHLSKILLFIDFSQSILPNMMDIQGYVNPGTYALVQSLQEPPIPVRDSVMLSTCTLSDNYYLVPTSSFTEPAFVVDNVGCTNGSLFVVPPMDKWAQIFL
jgi:hypothetical protein